MFCNHSKWCDWSGVSHHAFHQRLDSWIPPKPSWLDSLGAHDSPLSKGHESPSQKGHRQNCQGLTWFKREGFGSTNSDRFQNQKTSTWSFLQPLNTRDWKVLRYGVLGDSVNVAARLKSLNTHFGTSCLVSDESLEEAGWSRLLSITCRHWPEDFVGYFSYKTITVAPFF